MSYKHGLTKIRGIFMHQPLTKDLFQRMKQMVLYKVSNSLTVPLQVKNSKIEEKENGVKDPELLDKSIE